MLRRRGAAAAAAVALTACGGGTAPSSQAGPVAPCRAAESVTATPDPSGPAASPEPAPSLSPPGTDLALSGLASSQYLDVGFDALWVPQHTAGTVTRVDPRSGARQAVVDVRDPAVPPSSLPWTWAVAATETGVWVTSPRASALVCIDPARDAVAERVGLDAEAYALAPDGDRLWVTDFKGGRVLRVDLRQRRVDATVEDVRFPTGIAVGEGAVWVAQHRSGLVQRIDPDTAEVTADVRLRGTLEKVVVGHGAVWVAGNSGQALWRIDPRTREVTEVPLGTNAYGVAVDDDGLWVGAFPQAGSCESDRSGAVHVDAEDLSVHRVRFPCPYGVAVADGRAWVVQDEPPGMLARIATGA